VTTIREVDVTGELRRIGNELIDTSPADTVACAFGIGGETLGGYDDSDGRFFDLASLTKPLFTAPTVLGLLGDASELDGRVADDVDWVPRSSGSPTLRQLLTHAAGLPDEFAGDVEPGTLHAWLADSIHRVRGERAWVSYSDPGYALLGLWATARTGRPLPTLFADAPTATPGAVRFGGVAAEAAVPAGPIVKGVQLTHDPAARRLGLSGHAGAFGTLAGVVDAVARWIDPSWLPAELAEAAVTCQTHTRPGGHRSLAWTLAGDPFHVVAHDWPATTVCHSGFTGVSIVFDPVSRWWAVYLSNAIPVDRDPTPILIARRMFHATVATHLRATQTGPAR
jgi:CubicO group peptidase (beta-lactamase class C family)